jgi:hypothetical protein
MRSMVEGGGRPHDDGFNHRVDVPQNIHCGKPKHLIAFILKESGARSVAMRPIAAVVSLAIDLNHQIAISNKEVDDIRPYRVLPANLQPNFLPLQPLPKHRLGQAQ